MTRILALALRAAPRWLCVLGIVCGLAGRVAGGHELERTNVTLRFARDGAFVLDVANDPGWLTQRLANFSGPFSDRLVLWVDGHEVHPASVEYLAPPPTPPGELPNLGVYRLRGRMPIGGRTLRWYYGLVIDPYPLTIHRADGGIRVEEIAGDAWSGTIDLSGQFHRASWSDSQLLPVALVVGLLLVPPIVWLSRIRRSA